MNIFTYDSAIFQDVYRRFETVFETTVAIPQVSYDTPISTPNLKQFNNKTLIQYQS